ncbi:AMP-binding protein [Vibrio navarrensis]
MSQLSQRLKQAFHKHHLRPALWVQNTTYTYQKLEDRADIVARSLIKQRASSVLLFVGKSFDGYASILACALSETTYIPLNNAFPPEKLAAIIHRSGCRTLIVDEESAALLTSLLPLCKTPLKILSHSPLTLATQGHDIVHIDAFDEFTSSIEAERKENAYVYLMFTSGSTGTPKGVPVNQQNLLSYLDGITSLYDFSHEDRHSQFFDFTFDLSVHDLFVCWTTGGCLYAASAFDKLLPTKFVNTHQLTVWFSTPSMVTFAKKTMGQRFYSESMPTLRHSLFCGEALPDTVVEDWQHLATNSTVDNLYGPTEATIAFTLFRVERGGEKPFSITPIGTPFGRNTCAILNDAFLPVELNQVGQLYLIGPQVVDGYWQDAENTCTAFMTGLPDESGREQTLYRTGDLASYDDSGIIHFHGRADHQVKLRGYRVELQEIESLLRQSMHSDQFVVIPYPYGEKTCTGLTLCHTHRGATQEDILERCRQALPSYMVPDTVVFLQQLPMNSSGKLDRRAITEQLTAKE